MIERNGKQYPNPTYQQSLEAWCLLNDLIKLGCPHDSQKELPHIRNYMWKVTDLVGDAIHIRDGNEKKNVWCQPESQPKGKPPAEKTKGAETMQKLIDSDAVIEPLKEEYKKVKRAFDETSVFQAPNDVALYGALMQEVGAIIGMLKEAPAVTSADLGINEWCTDCKEYDQEKHCCHRFGRVIRQTQEEYLEQIPKWILCSERLPKVRQWVLCQCRAGIMDVLRLTADGRWNKIYPQTEYMSGFVVAWMPLPKPYEVEE